MNSVINSFFLMIPFFLFSLDASCLTTEEMKKYDELEGMIYIKALFRDKKFEEVIKESGAVKTLQGEKAEFVSLLTRSYTELKEWTALKKLLQKNENFSAEIPDYHLHMIRADFNLNQFKECAERFNRIDLKGLKGSDWLIFRQCMTREKKLPEVLKTFLYLESTDEDFYLQGQEILLENSLRTFAQDRRSHFLEKCQSVRSYLELSNTLRKFKIKDERVIEIAHACHPNVMEVTSLLIKDLFAKGNFHSIGYLFEELSSSNQEFYKHAAEFYKVAGRQELSRFYFQLSDEKTYVLSRASDYLNSERFIEFLSLPIGPAIRTGNVEIIYAQGFSAFKIGNVEMAGKLISEAVKHSDKIRGLMDLVDKCNQMDWRCRP